MSDASILPQEIVADVLSRLPIKSLCRFKCVSHSWYALISNPHFAQTHLTLNYNNRHERIILMARSLTLYSVDYYADVPVAKKLDFPSFPVESYNVWSDILGSCNGLILAHNEAIDAKYLLNPSTRESKKLPKSPFAFDSFRAYNLYGLGYDSSTDDYKVVMLSYYDITSDEESEGTTTDTDTIVSVYSLKARSWRSVQGSSYVHTAGDSFGVYVNGGLHWLASRGSDYLSVIVAFDLANENFREVPPPDSVDNDRLLWFRQAVLGGCLCLLDLRSSSHTDVWMMKEYGVRESWTKFTIYYRYMSIMDLVCLLEDGEFLLAMNGKKLVAYDPEFGTKRDMVVCGIPTMFTSGGTYVESLVSPDCGNGILGRCAAPGKRMKRMSTQDETQSENRKNKGKSSQVPSIKAQWDAKSNEIFIQLCVEQVKAGHRPGTHLDKVGWENVITKFKSMTGKAYQRVQMKNHWDVLKKDWLLWNNLLRGETGLGYDTLTGAISASDEWWSKKVERYPKVGKFRRMPLQFSGDLDILFSDAAATREWAYTPSSRVMPDTHDTPKEFHTSHDAANNEDFDLEVVHPSEINKKRPSNTDASSNKGKTKKKVSGAILLNKILDRIVNVVESSSATSTQTSSRYPSIAECLAKLESIPGVSPDDDMYVWAARLFLRDKRRECFMTLPTDEVRLRFLKLEIEMEKTSTGYRD